MNGHEYPFRPAAQGSHSLAQGARRGSSDRLAPPRQLSPDTAESQPRLACPYYKRAPNQPPKRASCIHPGFPSIARLKEHLYRRHQIFCCVRCNQRFDTEDEHDRHEREARSLCWDRGYQRDYNDGFDQKQRERVKKRMKASEINTDEKKWREIFRVLFPEDQEMPYTPYCHGAPSSELDNYHRYFQAHTDRVLQHRLGSTPNEAMKSLVRDVQEQLFEEFHALQSDDDRSSCTSRASTPVSSNASPGPTFDFGFEEDPPIAPADDGMQNSATIFFGEVVGGEVTVPNPQHVSFQYQSTQTPQIVLSRPFSPGPQACEQFRQVNNIAHVNIAGNSHPVSAYYNSFNGGESVGNLFPVNHQVQTDVRISDPDMDEWVDPSATGPNAFGT
ncbi:zn2 cys6 dna-binding protein [Diplodia corticola]|uniref:Zn2 cys6 dna-binding protein n=1 Tax=Diplodia corticola TaxID=236234 RepID=A0A1J9QTH5_9PEZI|nr:zn2 cys6 dna-binding protein [Diplodia corticola]OJD31290.1 zn2 cys6 dna-binding protein [Diplodia corticola]